jgi:PEP-CTERM motif
MGRLRQRLTIATAGALTTMLSAALSHSCLSNVMYTYQTNILNPLHENGISQSPPDYIAISFTVVAPLLPYSTYDISVSPSASEISNWTAVDSLFGIRLTGVDAPISLVPYPGLLGGGALTECDLKPSASCFGGAISTDQYANIVQWNLVADGPTSGPYLTFITYNTPYLVPDSVDALGSVQNGIDVLWENQLGVLPGFWSGPTPVSPVPEPSSIALLGVSLFGLLYRLHRRPKRTGTPFWKRSSVVSEKPSRPCRGETLDLCKVARL